MPLHLLYFILKNLRSLCPHSLRDAFACGKRCHRAVCRRAAYGEVTAAFPATLAQRHPDAVLYVNANAAQTAY